MQALSHNPPIQFPSSPSRRKPIEVSVGAASVRIYQTRWTDAKRRRTYTSHTLIWRDARGRHREKRASLALAKSRAQQIATSILNGETALLEFSHADRASYQRASELLKPSGTPLEVAAGIYSESHRILNGVSLLDAARFYVEQHPAGHQPKTIPEIVTEFLGKRIVCSKWLRNQKKIADRFAAKFPGQFGSLQARDLDDWLDSLPVGLRTRRNHLRVVQAIANFARTRGHVPKEWSVISKVTDPEPPRPTVNLYTPEELAALLATAEGTKAGQKLIPLIAITAFAGVRHGEMNEEKARYLDWSEIDFEAQEIYIGTDVAKTGSDRIADMPGNLVAWLKPYAKPSGKVVQHENTADALCDLRKKAARELLSQAAACANTAMADRLRELARTLSLPKRNALRKSFISYKNALTRDITLVADNAGNSPATIRKYYKRTGTKMTAMARRWFALMPQRSDALPLFTWAKGNPESFPNPSPKPTHTPNLL